MKLISYSPSLSNYPTSGDFPCEPYRASTPGRPWVIDIPDGVSHSRSWGKASGRTEIILNTERQVCLLVWWTGKAPGGQSYRHIVRRNGEWTRVNWPQLTRSEQERVLAATRPTWANTPGKLREERNKPEERNDLHKLVVVSPEGYRSLYDRNVVYRLGRTLTEAARDDHRGGFYAYQCSTADLAAEFRARLEKDLVPSDCIPGPGEEVAVIRVRTRGKHIPYSGGKYAASHLTPIEEVARFVVS